MQIARWALASLLLTRLHGEEPPQDFRWLALRGGAIALDKQEHAGTAAYLGGQLGMTLEGRRFGLTFEGLASHPASDLYPGKTLNHSEVSLSFLTNLSGEAGSPFFPYLGLGIGAISVTKSLATAPEPTSGHAGAAHMSFGFLHRPTASFIWGAEGRWTVTLSSPDRQEVQGAVMVGFSWGRPAGAAQAAAPEPRSAPPQPGPPPPPSPPAPPPTAPVAAAAPATVPEPPPVGPPEPAPAVVSPAPPPAPIPAPPAAAPAPAPVPPPPPAARDERTERLDALLLGDLPRAVALGRAYITATPPKRWTLRLEIADLPSTLKNAVIAFPSGKPDLFIAPIALKAGKTSYQLFLGTYPSRAEAERAAKGVPAFFLEGGQRPRPYQLGALPK